MKLNHSVSLWLHPAPPFAFDPTFHKPDHFTSGDNLWQPGTRWQTVNWVGEPFGLKFENQGSVTAPKIILTIFSPKPLSSAQKKSLVKEITYRYNLDLDLTDFYHQFNDHFFLGPIIDRWRGMRPGHPSSLYEYLIIGIVLQNTTVKRSIQMFTSLLENYGQLLEFDGQKLWCFWPPGRLQPVTELKLRDLKVGYRAKSIKKIDDYFHQGLIDEVDLRSQDLETQQQALLQLYGVGPATVWYLLFDVFHHWDFFNHISPWEQKIYSKVFFDRDPEDPVPADKLLQHFDQFGDYKQLAVHYIWEDLWWHRKNKHIPWLEKLIRL